MLSFILIAAMSAAFSLACVAPILGLVWLLKRAGRNNVPTGGAVLETLWVMAAMNLVGQAVTAVLAAIFDQN